MSKCFCFNNVFEGDPLLNENILDILQFSHCEKQYNSTNYYFFIFYIKLENNDKNPNLIN